MSPTKDTQESGKRSTRKASKGFTAEERAAMRERAREMKAAARGAEAEAEVLAKIAEMRPSDRAMAERIHAIVKASAPDLSPRTWYGMPAYAKDDKVVCVLPKRREVQDEVCDVRFKRQGEARPSAMWPTDFALTKLTAADEKKIAALVKKAVS